MSPLAPALTFPSSRAIRRDDVREQLRSIREHWRRLRASGRDVSEEEAARDWISVHAKDFRQRWEARQRGGAAASHTH